MKYIIEVELELPTDDDGLTDEGWEIASNFQNAIDHLHDAYAWKEITHVGMPRIKPSPTTTGQENGDNAKRTKKTGKIILPNL